MRALPLIAAAILLSACGTTETPATVTVNADAPVTVTDARGKQVTLKSAAKKVVVLEWGEAEMVASLGVMPAGVADPDGYRTWDTAATLDSTVKDVGKRQEPSEDAIAGLAPDVIIMAEERDSTLVPRLEKYAPVVVTKSTDATRNVDRLREDFKLIAATLGKTTEADKILADMDAKLAESRKAVETKGATGTPFLMADGWKEGSTINLRPFGKGSLVSDIAESVGLKNAYTGKVDPQWGLGQTDVEGLSSITDPKTILLYSASGEDVFTDGLAANPVWQRLPFVVSKKVTKLAAGTWTFGGPKSVVAIAEQVVKAATA
ncbi:iron complex transport system substrate-binding protein [Actinokineospora alba]|uniref:Iron complex transport system substrate-binding protein n=1 Tax=Actinokineospora alba TaxID=504798 RepID=A0A1H0VCL0_9PSEU|nr:iron-siderophore ABC transporter substrate-binding protein [Actinokineospora alba]TDP65630.1 iron complex transport system substrate-binding protein [Actinokineospora alba]SDH67105.1 iron complex transport system substrate-binding protein [Actinokineospora alba]SDP76084.1 iron complex transport system substrate-binding protein [Actinokineospora alba]